MSLTAGYAFRPRHLLGIEGLNRLDIEILLERGEIFANGATPPASLAGLTVATLFPEDASGAQAQFGDAARRLGANIVTASPAAKGETLSAIASRLNALKPDLAALRHPASGTVRLLSRKLACPVINAGDGAREDPIQALADALTLRRRFGETSGVRVAICGDILHSAIARSNTALLNILGAEVRLIAPLALMPPGAEDWGATPFTDLSEGLTGCDAAILLTGALAPGTAAFILQQGQQLEIETAIRMAALETLARRAAR